MVALAAATVKVDEEAAAAAVAAASEEAGAMEGVDVLGGGKQDDVPTSYPSIVYTAIGLGLPTFPGFDKTKSCQENIEVMLAR